MDEDHKASYPFDQSADRRTISNAHDAITLPVPNLDPVGNLDGPISDHRHTGEPTTPF